MVERGDAAYRTWTPVARTREVRVFRNVPEHPGDGSLITQIPDSPIPPVSGDTSGNDWRSGYRDGRGVLNRALSATAGWSRCKDLAMGSFNRIAPIFAVRDVEASIAHYERMGFATRVYEGGGYGFASRDGIEIHLGVVPIEDQRVSAAYLFVDDADSLAAEWRSVGVEVHRPEDTEWGQHEGAVVDPDGNVIRFGSPMKP
jgi:catechol 2,3-dioxygenase-like lactoylglutathione lyase family enzyme